MGGFKWTSASTDMACLSFFFGPWLLDTHFKLALACSASVLFGIVSEMVALGRRFLPSKRQHDLAFLFHLVNLFIAYTVMLVIMTYSVELFLSTLLGLLLGHAMSVTIYQRILKQYKAAGHSTSWADRGGGDPATMTADLCCRNALDTPLPNSPVRNPLTVSVGSRATFPLSISFTQEELDDIRPDAKTVHLDLDG